MMLLVRLLDWIRRHPALVLGTTASIMLLVHQALAGEVTWTVALPMVLSTLIGSVVTPSWPGWVSRNGLLLGTLGSVLALVGQVLDGTVTVEAGYPLLLGVLVKLGATPDPTPVVPFGGTRPPLEG